MQSETNSNSGPLAGLRVLELGIGVSAPYAGRLLAMLGATVVKVEPEAGDPARRQPLDDHPLDDVSPLYQYLNTGKYNVTGSQRRLGDTLEWAQVVLDSRVRNQAHALPALAEMFDSAEAPLYVTTTAWGFDAEEPGEIDDELFVQAIAGVTTLTGDPGASPLRLPGFQSQYLSGAYAAAATLSALAARHGGQRIVEVSWLGAMVTGAEGSYQRYLVMRNLPPPAGAHPLAAFPAGAFRCADGYVVPGTVRFHDWEMQCVLYGMPELLADERFATAAGRAANYRELWELIQPWYDAHERRDICDQALEAGWALGMILGAGDALEDPHLRSRAFLTEFEAANGHRFAAPARLAKGLESGWASAGVRAQGADSDWFDELVAVHS